MLICFYRTNIGYKYFKNGDSKLKLPSGGNTRDQSSVDINLITVINMTATTESNRFSTQVDQVSQPKLTLMGQECNLFKLPTFFIVEVAEEFYDLLRKLIWITYRSGFRPLLIEKLELNGKKVKHLTSDCNWGCTIRAGQMLLANTLSRCYPHATVPQILDL